MNQIRSYWFAAKKKEFIKRSEKFLSNNNNRAVTVMKGCVNAFHHSKRCAAGARQKHKSSDRSNHARESNKQKLKDE